MESYQKSYTKVGTKKIETLTIDKNLQADILGAQKIGVDQIYVNFEEKPQSEKPLHEVKTLKAILDIL